MRFACRDGLRLSGVKNTPTDSRATVDSHASRLRGKLRLTDTDTFVVNVWGVGYRLLE